MDEKHSPPRRGDPCPKPAPSATRAALLEVLQILALLPWLPFLAVAWIALRVSLLTSRAGDLLARPIYWAIVQAKRRATGAPPWQDRDWKIGVGPPCERCGVSVPPGRHRDDCRFVLPPPPPGEAALGDSVREPPTPTAEKSRMLAAADYVRALRDSRVVFSTPDGTVHLGAVLEALATDLRELADREGVAVDWTKSAASCRRLAETMEAR